MDDCKHADFIARGVILDNAYIDKILKQRLQKLNGRTQ